MMIPFEIVTRITELEYTQIRMIDRMFEGKANMDTGLTLPNFLAVLVYDFFRRSGMDAGRFAIGFVPFAKHFKEAADYLQITIDKGADAEVVPKIFVTLVDNRYVNVILPGQPEYIKLWDMVNEQWVQSPDSPPVFTLTLSIPALYFKAAAAHLGQQTSADLFKTVRTMTRETCT